MDIEEVTVNLEATIKLASLRRMLVEAYHHYLKMTEAEAVQLLIDDLTDYRIDVEDLVNAKTDLGDPDA